MEARLFEEGTVPEWTTPEWYAGRESAPHLEQEGHRQRLLATATMVNHAIDMGGVSTVDLGAGDGGLLSLIPGLKWGYDLQQSNVEAAYERGVRVTLMDVVDEIELIEWADIAVMTEMLEHLVDPHALVRSAHNHGVKWLVASSPYTETSEAHYDFHTWAWDTEGYERMLEDAGWNIVSRDKAWICQIVLAAR